MARYIGPVCRLCRREGMKLFLKGERCYGPKCAVSEEKKRNFPPGQHGQARKPKIVGYGLQLREKQKTKRYFGLGEGQFRNLFEKAATTKGITGEVMLQMLERRLDNAVYRIGFATSRAGARQLVRHGHVHVNGRKVNIPSFQVKAGDEVTIRDKSKENPAVLSAREATAHLPSPSWLEIDRENLKARVIGNPKREELVQINMTEQLIVELYSK
ncbi:MAG: 30S ribosomal protein S4 [Acidobacteria bacterium]|nr:30S ribosomal protein S4 [Acidobacteriota bacterium]